MAGLVLVVASAVPGSAFDPGVLRSSYNLAYQKPVIDQKNITGDPASVTDGIIHEDGSAWNQQPSIELTAHDAYIVIDLGAEAEIDRYLFQHDRNDQYWVRISRDRNSWDDLASNTPHGAGLITSGDFRRARGRYLQVGLHSKDGCASLSELAVFGDWVVHVPIGPVPSPLPDPGFVAGRPSLGNAPNLALGKPVIASKGIGADPGVLTDGQFMSEGSISGHGGSVRLEDTTSYFVIDLGSEVSIGRVVIQAGNDQTYAVEASSDRRSWKTLAFLRKLGQPLQLATRFADVDGRGRYLRVRIHGSIGTFCNPSVSELQVFGGRIDENYSIDVKRLFLDEGDGPQVVEWAPFTITVRGSAIAEHWSDPEFRSRFKIHLRSPHTGRMPDFQSPLFSGADWPPPSRPAWPNPAATISGDALTFSFPAAPAPGDYGVELSVPSGTRGGVLRSVPRYPQSFHVEEAKYVVTINDGKPVVDGSDFEVKIRSNTRIPWQRPRVLEAFGLELLRAGEEGGVRPTPSSPPRLVADELVVPILSTQPSGEGAIRIWAPTGLEHTASAPRRGSHSYTIVPAPYEVSVEEGTRLVEGQRFTVSVRGFNIMRHATAAGYFERFGVSLGTQYPQYSGTEGSRGDGGVLSWSFIAAPGTSPVVRVRVPDGVGMGGGDRELPPIPLSIEPLQREVARPRLRLVTAAPFAGGKIAFEVSDDPDRSVERVDVINEGAFSTNTKYRGSLLPLNVSAESPAPGMPRTFRGVIPASWPSGRCHARMAPVGGNVEFLLAPAPSPLAISASHSVLVFPSTPAGEVSEQRMTITNTGGAPAQTDVTLRSTGEGFSLVGSPSFQLRPGEAKTIAIRFEPREAKGYTNDLSIRGGPKVQLLGTGTVTPRRPVLVLVGAKDSAVEEGARMRFVLRGVSDTRPEEVKKFELRIIDGTGNVLLRTAAQPGRRDVEFWIGAARRLVPGRYRAVVSIPSGSAVPADVLAETTFEILPRH